MAEIDRSLRFCRSLHERPSGVVGGDAIGVRDAGRACRRPPWWSV